MNQGELNPAVTIRQGPLLGKLMKSRKGRPFCAFQGIPYAAPPVGELRFKPPQPPLNWTGAKAFRSEGSRCLQSNFATHELEGEEDCLYLNIYTPSMKKVDAGLPVMVFIHGGAFFCGSGETDMYGPELLLDQDVVLVTINYRIGVLGFLSLGIPECPGNYGLKDQVAALQWVQKNIAKFGGNPGLVTIFGESAGAASVHCLMLSPLAKGLFHRAVCQSASAHCDWAFDGHPERVGKKLTRHVGCQQASTTALLQSLRNMDARDLVQAEMELRTGEKRLSYFVPTVEPAGTEGAFLTMTPQEALQRGFISDVPLLVGLTTHESIITLGMIQHRGDEVSSELPSTWTRAVPHELGLDPDSAQFREAANLIRDFYEQLIPEDDIERFIIANSDFEFLKGIDELVRGFAALRRSPVFYYEFAYDGGLAVFKRVHDVQRKGTAHADDLGYLFSMTMLPGALEAASQNDLQTIEHMTSLWANFAKFGCPTPDGALGVNWEPVVAPLNGPNMADTRYLEINNKLTMRRRNLCQKRVQFWQDLVTQFRKFSKSHL